MTTFTLNGIQLNFGDEGESVAIGQAVAEIVMPSADSTFSYTIQEYDEDGVPTIEIDDDAIQVRLNGSTTDALEENAELTTFITQVEWSGGTTVILGVNIAPFGGNDRDLYFILDGPTPPSGSLDDWEAFDSSIVEDSLGAPGGAFGEGRDIAWSAFENSTSTEDDEFAGTAGDDSFDGGIGDDYFRSSDGADTYNGGRGFDQVTFDSDGNGVTANLKTGTATDGWGNVDTLRSIEMLRGSAYDDTFVGNGGRNIFRGLDGNDTLNGGKGRDQVRYDRDARYGGEEGVTVKLNKGFATDGFGSRDTLRSIEDARGSDLNDIITGNGGRNALEGEGGNDKLFGLNGNDTLSGGDGRDRLDGGGGDDMLNGGAGADRFVFRGTFGDDTISDFQTAGRREKIDLSDIGSIKSFRDLKNNHLSEDADGNAVISDNRGNSITLEDIGTAVLSADDFLF